jgi:hypothetical protein
MEVDFCIYLGGFLEKLGGIYGKSGLIFKILS